VSLAETRELFEVGVAPREIRDSQRDSVAVLLRSALGLRAGRARSVVRSGDRWVYLGVHGAEVQAPLLNLRGVHLTRRLRRDYPQGQLARGILGSVRDGEGFGGLESTFEAHLRGVPGRAVVAKDPSGRALAQQVFEMEPPRAGGDLVLTLDADLQAIAKEALAAAVDSTEATGGDLIITDPHTGEILAAVSLKGGVDQGLSFITEPVEPGSTIKPFTLANLLSRGRASLSDSLDVGEGRWTECGRTLTDIGTRGMLTLERAVQVSSNVAVAKAAQALDPTEQWEMLRDFGFGERTGIGLAGESSGVLRRPDEWTCQSPASHAIGYELSATPLQMTMAYGALANGGLLMEPRIVREVRHPDGRRETVKPRAVRRVVRGKVADAVTDVLVGVVTEGTGRALQGAAFSVAGKSGTARAYDGGYDRTRYSSSFIGYFPAESPRLVIYAKLDNAEDYGGALAGPVTRAAMEAALTSRGTPFNQASSSYGPAGRRLGRDAGETVIQFATDDVGRAAAEPRPTVPAGAWDPDPPRLEVQVPDLRGLPLREASRTLHALGLRVRLEGSGAVRGTRPAAGSLVITGDTILIRSGRADR
jgi:cell division protein FtsI (penicillin-binding protein 3)